jgi:hypothetical protein
MGGAGIKKDVEAWIWEYLIYCKNFYKYHDIPPPSTIIKINK